MSRIVRAMVLVALALVHIGGQPTSFTALVVRIGVPFTIVANHDGVNVTGYRVRDNGHVIATGLKGDVWLDGTVRLRLTSGLSRRGQHPLAIGAYNTYGETPGANTVLVTVANNP
jgi:hypothetical protein